MVVGLGMYRYVACLGNEPSTPTRLTWHALAPHRSHPPSTHPLHPFSPPVLVNPQAAVAKKLLTAEEVLGLPRDATGMLIVPEPARNATLLARSLEVVGFADEEGVRFQSTYLGSRALSGGLAASGALDARDASGVSLRELLVQRGVSDAAELAVGRGGALAYVEVHMEQGPVLEAAGARLAAVSGIAGQTRLGLTVRGEQGHAGTVPMPLRRDPVPAAAHIVAALERRCGGHAAKDSPTGLVCTVGTFQVWPGASNVIAG